MDSIPNSMKVPPTGTAVDADERAIAEPPVAGNETATLLGFLERQRTTFAWKCGGLDAVALQATVGASTMTLGGMLKHLAHIEAEYFCMWLHGRSLGAPWDSADWDADRDWDWHSAVDDTPEQLVTVWETAVEQSRVVLTEALAEGGLERQCTGITDDDGVHPTLRYLLLTIIEEYGRHNGHADLIRESVDGLIGQDPPN